MNFKFSATIWEWRGPAPFYFLSMPAEQAEQVRETAGVLSYGWGMIPINGKIQDREFKTSMFSKNGTYVVPIKNEVRLPLKLGAGDLVEIEIFLQN